jgi:hypothetical protein
MIQKYVLTLFLLVCPLTGLMADPQLGRDLSSWLEANKDQKEQAQPVIVSLRPERYAQQPRRVTVHTNFEMKGTEAFFRVCDLVGKVKVTAPDSGMSLTEKTYIKRIIKAKRELSIDFDFDFDFDEGELRIDDAQLLMSCVKPRADQLSLDELAVLLETSPPEPYKICNPESDLRFCGNTCLARTEGATLQGCVDEEKLWPGLSPSLSF